MSWSIFNEDAVRWEEVVGVEFDKENGYVEIAEKRLRHWVKESNMDSE